MIFVEVLGQGYAMLRLFVMKKAIMPFVVMTA